MTDDVRFDEASHTYTVNGVRYTAVSDPLAMLHDFSRVPRDVLERKRQIGRATHKCIELDEAGELDADTIDPAVAPYFESWHRFKAAKPLRVIASERIVYSHKHRVAGRLDLNAEFFDTPDVYWQIDAKCVDQMNPVTALQTACYLELWNERETPRLTRRAGLQLQPDGSMARLYPYKDRADFHYFCNALNCYRWVRNNGG